MGDSLLFFNNPLNMQVTNYAKVTFTSPSVEYPITPLIGLAAAISGSIDAIVCETRNEFKTWYTYNGNMVIFGAKLSVTVTGQLHS